jgi:pimeloyl-ACP methyl ester carboxylesterase
MRHISRAAFHGRRRTYVDATTSPRTRRLPGLINDLQLTVVEGGPHAIPWTHASQVNTALLDFLRH